MGRESRGVKGNECRGVRKNDGSVSRIGRGNYGRKVGNMRRNSARAVGKIRQGEVGELRGIEGK